jgi:hypothetical protein
MPTNIEQALRAAANQYCAAENPRPASAPIKERPVDPERVAKADRIRARIKGDWPSEFADGERRGLHNLEGYPAGFTGWELARRNAWWAGYGGDVWEAADEPA